MELKEEILKMVREKGEIKIIDVIARLGLQDKRSVRDSIKTLFFELADEEEDLEIVQRRGAYALRLKSLDDLDDLKEEIKKLVEELGDVSVNDVIALLGLKAKRSVREKIINKFIEISNENSYYELIRDGNKYILRLKDEFIKDLFKNTFNSLKFYEELKSLTYRIGYFRFTINETYIINFHRFFDFNLDINDIIRAEKEETINCHVYYCYREIKYIEYNDYSDIYNKYKLDYVFDEIYNVRLIPMVDSFAIFLNLNSLDYPGLEDVKAIMFIPYDINDDLLLNLLKALGTKKYDEYTRRKKKLAMFILFCLAREIFFVVYDPEYLEKKIYDKYKMKLKALKSKLLTKIYSKSTSKSHT
ncbi:hypothetical protein [Methanocaldococcus sp.]